MNRNDTENRNGKASERSSDERTDSKPLPRRAAYVVPRVEKRRFIGRVTLFSGGGASGGGSVGTSP